MILQQTSMSHAEEHIELCG